MVEPTKFRQVNEAFDWVFEAPKKDQVERLKTVASKNQTIVPLTRWGVGAEPVDWNLPEGMPEKTKLKEDIPDDMGESTLTLEFRRIKSFTDPTSNMANLPDWKREMNWMSIIEGVHHKEAEFLTAVKDVQLLSLYPKLEAILGDLGITDYVKPKKTRKKAVKKSAK
jgi:hypothetical protein|tara:strand:+ start:1972 stop:2472 length:501 start_codon:yes stop_codon:yes gene_type:complete